MIHYHGTPITPRAKLLEMAGRNFCVPFSDPRDMETCHQIGQSVMIDNGAFLYWKRNKLQDTPRDWSPYYKWVRPWLDFHTTWCVIPDVIDGTESDNGYLLGKWFAHFGTYRQAAPVWHLHESFDYLLRLTAGFDKVCFGSSGEYAAIGTTSWKNRINEAFNIICRGSGRTPAWIHMLRGMSLAGSDYPFSSVDSTDVAQNHWIKDNPDEKASKWDARQCPAVWDQQPLQAFLEELRKVK
jgi:hypothetical protein